MVPKGQSASDSRHSTEQDWEQLTCLTLVAGQLNICSIGWMQGCFAIGWGIYKLERFPNESCKFLQGWQHVSCLSTRSLAQDRGGLCALHVMSRAELGLRLPKTFGALDFDRALPLVDLVCYQHLLPSISYSLQVTHPVCSLKTENNSSGEDSLRGLQLHLGHAKDPR